LSRENAYLRQTLPRKSTTTDKSEHSFWKSQMADSESPIPNRALSKINETAKNLCCCCNCLKMLEVSEKLTLEGLVVIGMQLDTTLPMPQNSLLWILDHIKLNMIQGRSKRK
jgi:hypothetical protein